MSGLFLIVGILLVLAGAGASLWLPSAPSSIQTNAYLKPAGSFLIQKGSQVALGGLLLIILAVFVFGRRA